MHIDHEDRELILIALQRFRAEGDAQLIGKGNYHQIVGAAWYSTDLCGLKIGKIIERIEQFDSKGD